MASLTGVSVGFLGLGDVGRPVLRRLIARGADVYASSRSPALRYKMARDAAHLYKTPGEVCAHIGNGVIFVMLSKEALIDAFMEGKDGVLANIAPGTLIVDLGQTSDATTAKFARAVREKGAHWLAAPALGDEQAATEGRLAVAARGERADFDRALPLLQEIAREIGYDGAIGDAAAAQGGR
ncbi:NAD(P)-binding domain-containing protein [Sneathiella sp.]|uniref:NAD(P)-binding domain-containing protein n=1 Tax=Sneathiella sp. TaxID=1964365 RepID=UPI002FE05FFD